ncbi:MAG: aminotransferase class V-fold PLP-dependent enzyme [bacterium]|nr:aminotransferase class V-fold PLP-dependent enzyme [bacterium]
MNYKIRFSGRSHQYTSDEIDVVVEAMRNAEPLTQGAYRNAFEKALADFQGITGNTFAVGCATDALEMAAQLCQFKPGDELIIPSHTYTASAYPFIKKGANLVWADIDLQSRVVTAETIERCLSPKTKAILVVHLYGFVADMDPILELARSRNIIVIEDAAQAIGARYKGRRCGTMGDMGVFSFHSHKNITTLGEGGALWVRNDQFASIVPMLRHNGHCNFPFERDDYWIPAMGNVDLPELNGEPIMPSNYCLGEIECALGAALLKRIDAINAEKRRRALWFIDSLSEHGRLEFHRVDTDRHNYHLLAARMTDGSRDRFIRKMANEYGVQCVVQYYPLNRYDLYKKLDLGDAQTPNTDLFYDNMISFPFQQTLCDDDLSYMIDCTVKTLKSL